MQCEAQGPSRDTSSAPEAHSPRQAGLSVPTLPRGGRPERDGEGGRGWGARTPRSLCPVPGVGNSERQLCFNRRREMHAPSEGQCVIWSREDTLALGLPAPASSSHPGSGSGRARGTEAPSCPAWPSPTPRAGLTSKALHGGQGPVGRGIRGRAPRGLPLQGCRAASRGVSDLCKPL